MSEASNQKIDLEQSKISTLETEADKVTGEKDLQKKLQEHHRQFFEQVDSARSTLKGAETKISDTDLRESLDTEQQGMFNFLAGAAEKGREILIKEKKNQKGETSQFKHIDAMALLLHGLTERADKVGTSVIALQESQKNMDSAKPLMETVEQIRADEKLDPTQKRQQLLLAAENAIVGLTKAKKSISSADKDTLAEINLDHIYDETANTINTNLTEVAEIKVAYRVMDFIEKHGTEEIATVTTEQSIGEFGGMGAGIVYTAENPALVKTKKVYFTIDANGNVRKTRDFNALPPERQIQLWNELNLIRDQVNEEIEKKCVDETREAHLVNFYEGKAKMYAGNFIGSKADLLIFYNEEIKRPPEEQEKHQKMIEEARELLKQIAMLEIAQMKQRYELMRADVEAAYANMISAGPTTFGATKTSAETVLNRLEIVLFETEQQIESGNALTVGDAAQKLRAMQIKPETRNSNALKLFQEGHLFDAKETAGWTRLKAFDVFSQQKLLSEPDPVKRMQNIKALAEKARSLGLTEVAKHYYEMYFQKEISEEAKHISRDKIAWILRRDPKVRAEIDQRYTQWEKDFSKSYKSEKNRQFRLAHPNEPIPETPTEEIHNAFEEKRPTARRSIMETMINDRYNAKIKIRVNAKFKKAEGERADTWNNTYNQFFSSLEKIPGNISVFSDAEWEQFKATIIPQLAILAASGTVAGGVARALVGTALRDALIASGMEAAAIDLAAARGSGHFTNMVVSQLGPAKAAQYGAASFGVETAAFTATSGALNALVFNDASTFANPEAFAEAWGHGALMLGACKTGNIGYSFIPKPKKLPGVIAYQAGSLTTEVAALNTATLGLSILTTEEITAQQLMDMTKDNIVFCVGLRGGHALTGGFTGPTEMAEKSKVKTNKPSPEMQKIITKGLQLTLKSMGITRPEQIYNQRLTRGDRGGYFLEVLINGLNKSIDINTEMSNLPKEYREALNNQVKTQELATSIRSWKSIDSTVAEFNNNNKPQQERAFQIIHQKGDQVVYFNEQGKLTVSNNQNYAENRNNYLNSPTSSRETTRIQSQLNAEEANTLNDMRSVKIMPDGSIYIFSLQQNSANFLPSEYRRLPEKYKKTIRMLHTVDEAAKQALKTGDFEAAVADYNAKHGAANVENAKSRAYEKVAQNKDRVMYFNEEGELKSASPGRYENNRAGWLRATALSKKTAAELFETDIVNLSYRLRQLGEEVSDKYERPNPETDHSWYNYEIVADLEARINDRKKNNISYSSNPEVHRKMLFLAERLNQNHSRKYVDKWDYNEYSITKIITDPQDLPAGWEANSIDPSPNETLVAGKNFIIELQSPEGKVKYKVMTPAEVGKTEFSKLFESSDRTALDTIMEIEFLRDREYYFKFGTFPNSGRDIKSLEYRVNQLKEMSRNRPKVGSPERAQWNMDFNNQAQVMRAEISQRKTILRDTHQKVESTIRHMATVNPEQLTLENVLKHLDMENIRKIFSRNEIITIELLIHQLIEKTHVTTNYYNNYKSNPKGLFKMLFGVMPTGEVILIKTTFGLGFICRNETDYFIAGGTPDSGGVALSRSSIDALKNTIMLINGRSADQDTINKIAIHEERHQINSHIFRALGTESHARLEGMGSVKTEGDAKRFFGKYLEQTLTNARDEILAYLSEGRAQGATVDTLTDPNGLYNYWQDVGNLAIVIPAESSGAAKSGSQETTNIQTAFPKLFQEFQARHFALVRAAIRDAFTIGDVFLLSVTPISEWRNISKDLRVYDFESQARVYKFTKEQVAEINKLTGDLYASGGEDLRGKAIINEKQGDPFKSFDKTREFLLWRLENTKKTQHSSGSPTVVRER